MPWRCLFSLLLALAGFTAAAAEPATGAKPPRDVTFETNKTWSFKDGQLAFFNPSPNADGSRYLSWKDLQWAVSEKEITVYDPRPAGVSFAWLRHKPDDQGQALTDKDLMERMQDEARRQRQARTPARPPLRSEEDYLPPEATDPFIR